MRKKAIVFNGDGAIEIGIDYFFQHPVIEKLSKLEVFLYYQATAVYASTLRTIMKLSSSERLVLGYDVEPDYLEKVTKGEEILQKMVIDLYPLTGKELVAEVNKTIKKEENEKL